MKKSVVAVCIFLLSCGAGKETFHKAENALDAGREFVFACQNGDFARAAFYMLPSDQNTEKLRQAEKAYREKDKEGRQQARSSSMNISEIKELNDSTTLIYYSNSADKQPVMLEVIKQNGGWLVNFNAKQPISIK